jgi:hypothetical protein
MLGLFIWFLFGIMLSQLEDIDKDAVHKTGNVNN